LAHFHEKDSARQDEDIVSSGAARDIPEARRTAPAKMALRVVLRPNMMRNIYRWTGGCGWAEEG